MDANGENPKEPLCFQENDGNKMDDVRLEMREAYEKVLDEMIEAHERENGCEIR